MRDVDAVILMLFAVSQYTDCSVHCSFQSEGVDLAGVAVENPVVINLVHSHWSRMSRIVSHWSRNVEARLSLVESFPNDASASNLMP